MFDFGLPVLQGIPSRITTKTCLLKFCRRKICYSELCCDMLQYKKGVVFIERAQWYMVLFFSMFSDLADVAQFYLSDSSAASIILVGHSLGGAVCVHAASRGLIPGLAGLVVIDVVEGTVICQVVDCYVSHLSEDWFIVGTALESLSMMESLVRAGLRPSLPWRTPLNGVSELAILRTQNLPAYRWLDSSNRNSTTESETDRVPRFALGSGFVGVVFV